MRWGFSVDKTSQVELKSGDSCKALCGGGSNPTTPNAKRGPSGVEADDEASPPPPAPEVDPKAVTLDPALKAKFRRITASIVKYVEVGALRANQINARRLSLLCHFMSSTMF